MSNELKTYLFNWNSGGYNTVQARNKKHAAAEIRLGKQWRSDESFHLSCGGVKWDSLRLPKKGEVEALDKHYAGMFD